MTGKRIIGRRRRGVATIEFAMTLPLLMFLGLLMIFFGKAMITKEDTLKTDRLFGDRQAKGLPGAYDEYDQQTLRENFFRNQDVTFSIGGGWGASRASEHELADTARSVNTESGQLADSTVIDRFPRNVSHGVDVAFPLESMPLARFAHDVRDTYYRQGNPWRYRQTSIWDPLNNQFLNEFDNALTSRNTGNDGLVNRIRQLYQKHW